MDKVDFSKLPELLLETLDPFYSQTEKDIILMSTLSALSAVFWPVHGLYGGKKVHPHIYVLILGPPGTGKGVMILVEFLINETQIRISIQNKMEPKPKRNAKTKFSPKGLFLPANASSAAVISFLSSNPTAFMIDAEADSVSKHKSSDWGDYSELLRKAFQHETISELRKGDQSYLNLYSPNLSIALSGTDSQLPNLLVSAADGLLSRFLIYRITDSPRWKSVAPREDGKVPEDIFKTLSPRVDKIALQLEQNPLNFVLSPDHWAFINQQGTHWLGVTHQLLGVGATGLATRAGLQLFRIAMILSVLRNEENLQSLQTLTCTSEDLDLARNITDACFKNSLEIFCELQPKQSSSRVDTFFEALPSGQFTSKEAIEIAKQHNMAQRTAYNSLNNLVSKGLINKGAKQGEWIKPENSKPSS